MLALMQQADSAAGRLALGCSAAGGSVAGGWALGCSSADSSALRCWLTGDGAPALAPGWPEGPGSAARWATSAR